MKNHSSYYRILYSQYIAQNPACQIIREIAFDRSKNGRYDRDEICVPTPMKELTERDDTFDTRT